MTLKQNEIGLFIMDNGVLRPIGLSKENASMLQLVLANISANEPLVKGKEEYVLKGKAYKEMTDEFKKELICKAK